MKDNEWTCNCKGGSHCGPDASRSDLGRREFMKSAGLAAGGLGLALTGSVPAVANPAPDAWTAWEAEVFAKGERRHYRGEELTHIAVPMGGIGAGQVFITGRGTLEQWQILNNFNGNANVSGSFFAIWTRTVEDRVVVKRLQEGGEETIPSTQSIDFSCEYPFAWLKYNDNELPVDASLEVYSPFIPSNTKDSGLPAVLFEFTVRNSRETPVETAVMVSAPNVVGWDGYGQTQGTRYVDYEGNENKPVRRDDGLYLRMQSLAGDAHSLSEACDLLTNDLDVANRMRMCNNVKVYFGEDMPGVAESVSPVFWVGDLSEKDLESGLPSVLEAVKKGASLILSGNGNTLLKLAGKSVNDQAVSEGWYEALPIEWTALRRDSEPAEVNPASSLLSGLTRTDAVKVDSHCAFAGLIVKPGARVLLTTRHDAPLVIEGSFGEGKVIVCAAPIHRYLQGFDRKTFIGNTIALATKATYRPQSGWHDGDPFHGATALAILNEPSDISVLPQWDDPRILWEDFAADGRFDTKSHQDGPSGPGQTWNGAISVPFTLGPGEERRVTFALAWHFPNRMRDHRYGMGPHPPQYDFRLGNQYNNWFENVDQVVEYVSLNYDRLRRDSKAFHGCFYDSTLPHWLLDLVTANASIIRSPIYIWLEDGTVGAFEGSDACCPMNCTHVFNYAMSPAFLFPQLERKVREIDLLEQMNPDEHFIPHRTLLPLSLPRLGNEIAGPFHHALDGELGTILKTYREWQVCGDTAWLNVLWPNVKKVMQHVMRDHDVDGDGVIKGEQPNTYDVHTYGSNTFIGTLYLASLKATAEMARALGDTEIADACQQRLTTGSEGYDRVCWSGKYYRHMYDAPGATPDTYEDQNSWGPGCHADQLLGQWWAHIMGFGHLLPSDHVGQALDSIYHYSWRRDLTDHVQTQRVFAEGTEKGLLNCTWPTGGRPANPINYRDEIWTGIEYEVAASLVFEGKIAQGLHIAKGARDRYTGNQRNPWSEIECGGHYARAMSSYSLLLALGGYHFDRSNDALTFVPSAGKNDMKVFFAVNDCWGSLRQQRSGKMQRNEVRVEYGQIQLARIEIETATSEDVASQVHLNGSAIPLAQNEVTSDGVRRVVNLREPIVLNQGSSLEVRCEWN